MCPKNRGKSLQAVTDLALDLQVLDFQMEGFDWVNNFSMEFMNQ